MKNYKIATHNSATGEKSHSWRWVLVPFARCQSKSLLQQVRSGATLLDLRVRLSKRGWVFAHGPWASRAGVLRTLRVLDLNCRETIVLNLAYEGRLDAEGEENLISLGKYINKMYAHLQVSTISVKKPTWHMLSSLDGVERHVVADYEVLDETNWKRLIPIPWLWKRIAAGSPSPGENPGLVSPCTVAAPENSEIWRMVDFL